MANDFSIILSGGKQYRISSGDVLNIEKLIVAEDGKVVFDKVLLRSVGGNVEIGTPYIAGAKIAATLIGHGREEKKIVFKYHSKTRQRKKKGHRQEFTEVTIN